MKIVALVTLVHPAIDHKEAASTGGTTSRPHRRNVVPSHQQDLVIRATLAHLFGNCARTPPPSCTIWGAGGCGDRAA